MRYQKVYSRLWTEARFRLWDDDVRTAALYLLTCPHRNTEGLFRLPVPLAAHDLGWATERTTDALGRLQLDGFIDIDIEADLIWLVEALEWDPPVGPKQVKGAVRALAELPPSRLRSGYLRSAQAECPDLAKAIEEDLGWVSHEPDPPPETVSVGGCPQEDDPSIAQALSPPPSRAHTPPPHPPRSTQEGHGQQSGEGEDPEAEAVQVVALAHELAGLAKPSPPRRKEISTVARLLAKGWTKDQLTAPAEEAFARSDVASPRPWLLQAWENKLDRDPPKADLRGLGVDELGAKPLTGPGPVGRRRVHPEDCPGRCSDEGWVDLPNGQVAKCTGQPIEAQA